MSRPVRKASRSAKPAVTALEGRQLLALSPLSQASRSAALMMNNLQAAAARTMPVVVAAQTPASPAGAAQAASRPGSSTNELMANLATARAASPLVVTAKSTITGAKGSSRLSKGVLLPASQPVSTPSVVGSSAATTHSATADLLARNLAAHSSGQSSPAVVFNATAGHAAPAATKFPTKKG